MTERHPRIILVRHGRPQTERDDAARMNWREYRNWWEAYENSSLSPDQGMPATLTEITGHAPFLFSSSRPRAMETARVIACNREIRPDPIFAEAPQPSPHLPLWLRFSPATWGIIARTCWLCGMSDGEETPAQAYIRASCAAETLSIAAGAGSDVILVAHGWFNRMLGTPLWKRGWRCIHNSGDGYWSHRIYRKRTKASS